MTVREIYTFLDRLSPFELQEKWDNSGLMVGDFSQEISRVVLSIDIDAELIDSLEENTLLITHHPIIFGGVKQLQSHHYPANMLIPMIRKNIANIAMHTNFDQTHLNDYVATRILGYPMIKKEGFAAYLEVDEPFAVFAARIKKSLGLEHIRGVQSHSHIHTCALVSGSGASLLRSVEADCFLTGDIKYHDAMEAKALGLSMIDIGHYESERFFGEILAEHLKNLGLSVIISPSKNPFTYL
ncbi:MAG: Nif3-like dinuclear metal center hexameric protein [Sulfuricurvum sp.]|jgi:dinuclear metal center YbgI/SA1388 family protein|uniref:Nif3-like dinuclear metal center hexameric protein n=1 Tax=Sulfuricurvum sp. TaxID=2025608 RepID=UPI0025D3CCAE|nr:Nif3-like dinuclear metal center hexameric protein [Sulfuricurvum sp.]MCK9373062.1 Nif3-like dinuclear metal center hexameric protein [Sulfuricurvum sp.]